MNTEHLYRLIEQITQQMDSLNESVSILQSSLKDLAEENERLKLANQSLIAIFSEVPANQEESSIIIDPIGQSTHQDELADQPTASAAYVPVHGGSHERLQAIYDEGIHVCHEMFGTKREDNEGCLMCLDIIDRLA
ncbi:initiation control protein YabA [Dolosicoccus paucivorans]